jgi:hypothetical protein
MSISNLLKSNNFKVYADNIIMRGPDGVENEFTDQVITREIFPNILSTNTSFTYLLSENITQNSRLDKIEQTSLTVLTSKDESLQEQINLLSGEATTTTSSLQSQIDAINIRTASISNPFNLNNLFISGNTTLKQVTINSSLNVSGNTTLQGNTLIENLIVQNENVENDLIVSGTSLLRGDISGLSSLNISGNTLLRNSTTILSSLNISGNTTITGQLIGTDTILNGSISATGNLNLLGNTLRLRNNTAVSLILESDPNNIPNAEDNQPEIQINLYSDGQLSQSRISNRQNALEFNNYSTIAPGISFRTATTSNTVEKLKINPTNILMYDRLTSTSFIHTQNNLVANNSLTITGSSILRNTVTIFSSLDVSGNSQLNNVNMNNQTSISIFNSGNLSSSGISILNNVTSNNQTILGIVSNTSLSSIMTVRNLNILDALTTTSGLNVGTSIVCNDIDCNIGDFDNLNINSNLTVGSNFKANQSQIRNLRLLSNDHPQLIIGTDANLSDQKSEILFLGTYYASSDKNDYRSGQIKSGYEPSFDSNGLIHDDSYLSLSVNTINNNTSSDCDEIIRLRPTQTRINNNLFISGNTTLNSNLSASIINSESQNINNNLLVTGNSLFRGEITLLSSLNVSGNTLIQGQTTMMNNLLISGTTSRSLIINSDRVASIELNGDTLNLGGEPLVETLDDAVRTLANSDMEYLYLPEHNLIIEKKNAKN